MREDVKKLYMFALRKVRGNELLKAKASDGQDFKLLKDILEMRDINPLDYIQYHFRDIARFVPSAKYITSSKAIESFLVHQKLKNKYLTDDYAIDGENFYVNKTYKNYPLSQVKMGAVQDLASNHALYLAEKYSEEGYVDVDKNLWEEVEYTYCKFKYKNKDLPTVFDYLLKKVREWKANEAKKQ